MAASSDDNDEHRHEHRQGVYVEITGGISHNKQIETKGENGNGRTGAGTTAHNGLKGLTMDSKRTLPPYLQAHLKTAQATARPKFLKELAKPTQERISNFFPTL